MEKVFTVKQPHASDGAIINQNEAVASCFHCPYTFKWKSPPDMTMDLLCLIHEEKVFFFTRKRKKPLFHQPVEFTLKNCCSVTENPDGNWQKRDRQCHSVLSCPRTHLHLQVVECFYCPHDKLWKPKKIRHDKEFPNSQHVLEETIKVLKKPIYLTHLVNAWKRQSTS